MGDAALQAVVPHLSPDVVSNLVREASLCIADAMADSNVPQFYTPTSDKAPTAYGLRVEPPSQFSVGMGSTVTVRTRGSSAPYMAVRVPLHVGPALCLWGVYVCVKPGGNFANDNPGWVVAEGSTNAAPVVTLGNEVRLYAQLHSLP
jgi:sugar (pentulose or hexulose) kinase